MWSVRIGTRYFFPCSANGLLKHNISTHFESDHTPLMNADTRQNIFRFKTNYYQPTL